MASVRGRQGFCSPKRSLITVPLKPCAAQMARITIIRLARPTGSIGSGPINSAGEIPTMTLQGAVAKSAAGVGWRTPMVVIICGCLISMISFGPRSSLGFFLTPLSQANHWEREVFALALAIQNLLWGIGQPFAGATDIFAAPLRGVDNAIDSGRINNISPAKMVSAVCQL